MRRLAPVAALALVLLAAPAARAQYNYGGGGYGGYGEGGLLLLVEGSLANPRGADHVTATAVGGSRIVPVVPPWDDELAGRLGIGWAFAGGSRVSLTVWRYETKQSDSGSGVFAFPIGPAISVGSSFEGATGGYYASDLEMTARTADLAWGRTHALDDRTTFDWSVGLRYASFEETEDAVYDEALVPLGQDRFAATKRNKAEMIGARVGLEGRYRLTRALSLAGGVGLAHLDGKLEARSELIPTGTANSSLPASLALQDDDGRSGTITDLEVGLGWQLVGERVRLSLGWEQSAWDELTADLLRNLPGTVAPQRERDTIIFSGYKIGLEARF